MYAGAMDLRQLEIIRAIADSGSFTAAGEKLHVSQSAISRQILLLEDELGEPVFHRIGRRIRAAVEPSGLSGPARYRRDDQRYPRIAQRHYSPGRWNDGLLVRVSDA